MFFEISAIISAMFKRKLLKINKLARLAQKARFCYFLIHIYLFICVYK